ncbi:tetratricopeptide repeat-containing sensor histidine kinase [Chitinophaga pinensis]|uniref:histidine kinase n=1 Tax=Chitinophaga pinensis (strain ATCC 43595 / DSM 2588 / LMG 13176 / NBRC 15968 / NCIMB 11800 / UQM 2034) TaxID=485918 RepID=A0A979G6U9_CHIPD|nr:histidine kinase dimerization/phosphoacceptor domain -containing protein [Chitinophaga pinensis]ACU61811.1 signal transduction histidine kinase [Chitinophaga pinensis DSM 2588]
MVRILFTYLLLSCLLSKVYAQSTVFTATINHYNESQKRLLATNIGRFFYVVNQGQWDMDSCVRYVCKIYHLNIQLPYDETINNGNLQQEVAWLNQHAPNLLLQSIPGAAGEKRVAMLLELALYYLHKPGNDPSDLENTATYITQAKAYAKSLKLIRWLIECDAVAGDLYLQQGDAKKSSETFALVASFLKNNGDKKRNAIAVHQLALHLPYNDANRLSNLEKAFATYQELQLKEHAIAALGDIVTYYFSSDWSLAEAKLGELLVMQKQSGYRHFMDTYYVRAYLKNNRADYIGTTLDIDSALTIMTNTGDSSIYSMVCTRMGSIYMGLGEYQQANEWYFKGIERRAIEPQILWYTNLEEIGKSMPRLNKANEYLSFIRKMLADYPPEGEIDSITMSVRLGEAYLQLHQHDSAEKYFQPFLAYVERIPPQHLQMPDVFGFQQYARLCFQKGNYPLARVYLQKVVEHARGRPTIMSRLEVSRLQFAIDSAEGKFHDAFFALRDYVYFNDSAVNINQRFKSQEANIRYASEKKDQDIQILKQQGLIQEGNLKQARQMRNIVSGGIILLLIIGALGYNQYRMKQKNLLLIGQKNDQLTQLVNEKEWLLKEVHHRVKNNLQTIVSLLEMQADYLGDDALAAVQVSQNRIFATSLLHQKLYQFENVSSVNMKNYLPELIQHLREAFPVGKSIDIQMTIDDVELDVSQAMPVGLIFNEAFTNTMKYAFRDNNRRGKITVSCEKDADNFVNLLIADNGIGFNATGEAHTDGLGLSLIKGLAIDIDGEAKIESGTQGTTLYIRFKVRSPLSTNRLQ